MFKLIGVVIVVCSIQCAFSQESLTGIILNKEQREGIHVFNKSKQLYTVTNQDGEFTINAKAQDTVTISGLGYKLKTLYVTKEDLERKVKLLLEVEVDELETVFIKPKLSGNLLNDSKSIKTLPQISAKTLGLPNASVKRRIKQERQLYTAQSSALVSLINSITGKSKLLKMRLKNRQKEQKEDEIFVTLKETLVLAYRIPEDKVYDFIYFASNDQSFMHHMKSNSNLNKLSFLETKVSEYLQLINKDQ